MTGLPLRATIACAADQRRAAAIGVADGVEDQVMRRQRQIGPVIVGVQSRHGMDAIIQNMLGGNIAAPGGDQHQQRSRFPIAAIGLGGDRLARKTLAPVLVRQLIFAKVLGDARQTAMRIGQRRVERKRGLKLQPRTGQIAILVEKAAQIDPTDRVQRPMANQLLIGRAGGGAMTTAIGQPSQPMQAGQMVRQTSQQRDIGRESLVIFAVGGKAPGLGKKRFRIAVRRLGRQRLRTRLGKGHGVRRKEIGPRIERFLWLI